MNTNGGGSAGDFDALNAYLTGNGLQDSQVSMGGGLGGTGKLAADAKDEQQLQISRLMNDLKNIR